MFLTIKAEQPAEDQSIGLVQRLAHRLPLRFGQVDDGLQPAGYFAESVDQVGEELEFHNCGPSPYYLWKAVITIGIFKLSRYKLL